MTTDYYTKENCLIENRKSHISSSGKYKLVIDYYTTKKGCWNYSRGRVYDINSDELIADVKRNYGAFPFSWVDKHTNGHSYLICGADYQGQTIIELDTKQRVDYTPSSADSGVGFCWSDHIPSPDGNMLMVDGCYWACPYELRIYDFSEPMKMPLLELDVNLGWDEFGGWMDDNSCKIKRDYEWSKVFNKSYYDLTDEEQDKMEELENKYDSKTDKENWVKNRKELWERRQDSIVWTRPSNLETTIKYINGCIKWRATQKLSVVDEIVDITELLVNKLSPEELQQFNNTEEKKLFDYALTNKISWEELTKKVSSANS
jgi:hypothetical protein